MIARVYVYWITVIYWIGHWTKSILHQVDFDELLVSHNFLPLWVNIYAEISIQNENFKFTADIYDHKAISCTT